MDSQATDVSHDGVAKRFFGKTSRGDEFFLEYDIYEEKILDAHHTFVPSSGRGQGLAEKLTIACFEFAKNKQLLVQPSCSYISNTFLKRYPKYIQFTTTYSQALVLEMVSDPMCPWCFLGKRKLDAAVRALNSAGVMNIQTRFHPWLLQPKLAMNKTKFFNKRKFYLAILKGSEEKFNRMVQKFSILGHEDDVGIDFKFEGDIGTTIDAAQLIYWAGVDFSDSQQSLLVDQLFSAYHEQGKNVALHSVLFECVSKVPGLPVNTAKEVLVQDRYRKAVEVSTFILSTLRWNIH